MCYNQNMDVATLIKRKVTTQSSIGKCKASSRIPQSLVLALTHGTNCTPMFIFRLKGNRFWYSPVYRLNWTSTTLLNRFLQPTRSVTRFPAFRGTTESFISLLCEYLSYSAENKDYPTKIACVGLFTCFIPDSMKLQIVSSDWLRYKI